jgi:hypothetical protein
MKETVYASLCVLFVGDVVTFVSHVFREQGDNEGIRKWQNFRLKFLRDAYTNMDRLCGLVVRVLGYRSGGPGSIPGTTRKKKVASLERGPLSLVSTSEELLERSSGFGLENREYGRRDPSRWSCGTLYPQKLAVIRRQAAVARSV